MSGGSQGGGLSLPLHSCKSSLFFSLSAQGRKGARSKKSGSTLPFDWSEVKKDFLNVTTQLLQINIVSLWEPPVVEDEFVKYVFQATSCLFSAEFHGIKSVLLSYKYIVTRQDYIKILMAPFSPFT